MNKSDGMNSYLEREQRKYLTLNADAETFVPVAPGLPSQCIPEDVQLRSHLPDARPKEINVGLLEPKVQQNKIYREQVCKQFQLCMEDPVPVAQNGADHNRLITVLEKKN